MGWGVFFLFLVRLTDFPTAEEMRNETLGLVEIVMRTFLIAACLGSSLASAQEPSEPTSAQPPATASPAVSDESAPAAAPVSPPKWSDRRNVFLKKLFGGQAILETMPGTAFDTARGFPRQWGRGGVGIAKRIGSQYGQFVVGEFIEAGVSIVHKEDPRYFRMPGERFGRRLRHSLVSTVVVRGVNGSPTIGIARLANVYGSWAIATTWNPPDQRNIWKIAGWGTLGLGIKAGSNVFREFWPDVKKRLKKH